MPLVSVSCVNFYGHCRWSGHLLRLREARRVGQGPIGFRRHVDASSVRADGKRARPHQQHLLQPVPQRRSKICLCYNRHFNWPLFETVLQIGRGLVAELCPIKDIYKGQSRVEIIMESRKAEQRVETALYWVEAEGMSHTNSVDGALITIDWTSCSKQIWTYSEPI